MRDDDLERLNALYSRLNYERSGMPRSGELRLERMRRLLRVLGDPHRGLRIVHVAGTKGKGSTSTLIAAALSAAGVRTGLYTSPHLHRLEERFQVDGKPIRAEALNALIDRVMPAVAVIDAQAEAEARRPLTFFEVTTAMGLVHFAEVGAGAVVLEVGLGGRLDSTNVVRPLVSVITSISYDHTRQLGNTLGAIAGEKAGIIKRGGLAVSGVPGRDARAAIERVARQRRATLHEIGRSFGFSYEPPTAPLARPAHGRVRVATWRRAWEPLLVPFHGEHQAANAAVAIAALEALGQRDPSLRVDEAAVRAGWNGLRLPARVEVVSEDPLLVIDGAHNAASARALAETLVTHFPSRRRILIFGTTRDKDLVGQLRWLGPLFERTIATRYLENPRSVAPAEVAAAASRLGFPDVRVAESPAVALELAQSLAGGDALICVTGSLFLAAEIRALVLRLPPAPRPTAVGV
ncbi:MAG: bifunctional folylpolyglutamate synthase/dihydrofolate synthase [Isosphaeraceae bacterium]|jgi:dihydrofolate synthase/folylpolyglutamate synthase|nr:MAG: bifunctional folylpolyglutamate synthase/dihydrofolate synthase [Isosphaeraceae bacterium]